MDFLGFDKGRVEVLIDKDKRGEIIYTYENFYFLHGSHNII